MEGQLKSKNNGIAALKLLTKNGVIIILIAVLLVLAVLTGGKNLSVSNLLNILMQTATMGIMAIGMTLVIIDRGIDLSVGGVAAFASATGALLMTRQGLPWGVCVAIMLLVGIGFGALNGFAVAVLKMPAFITTMAVLQISRGMAHFILGGTTVFGLPEIHAVFGQGYMAGLPVSVWLLIGCTVIVAVVLKFTRFGRELYAMGGNPKAAWTAGINVVKNRISIYMISGLMSSVAALIITSRIMCAQVTIGDGSELDAIASAVIGGVSMSGGEGNVVGAVLGAIVIVMINNGLNLLAVSPYLQTAIKGIVIFVAIAADVLRRRKELKD
jgi:ribose/xylose/arabinose/galactoside ABC-type transport system permease subunit